MKKQTVSVVLATFNEEKNIGECLKSAKDFADEIIIVDGSSTDRTVEIAKSFGAKIIITTNPPIFHINKQKAIDKATKDWILQLDADERVSPELKNEIINSINDQKENISGYWIPRKNWFLDRFLTKGGQYPDYTMRLYKNGKGKLPQKDIHEQAVVEGRVDYLKNPLLHYSFNSFSDYMNRFNKYTTILSYEYKSKKISKSFGAIILFFLLKPLCEFYLIYIRNKGFIDGFSGFVFAFFSSLRYPIAYIKYMENRKL